MKKKESKTNAGTSLKAGIFKKLNSIKVKAEQKANQNVQKLNQSRYKMVDDSKFSKLPIGKLSIFEDRIIL